MIDPADGPYSENPKWWTGIVFIIIVTIIFAKGILFNG